MASRKITIQFGLMAVPMNMDVAVDKPVALSNLCVGQPEHKAHEASPLKAPKTCIHCGEITDIGALVKGQKEGSVYTIIDPAEVAKNKEQFTAGYKGKLGLIAHPAEEFATATAQGDSLHYLTPADASAEGHYKILAKLVSEHPEIAFVGLHTPVSATALYQLRTRDGVLVLEKRTREQNVKPAPSVGGEVDEALYTMLSGALPSLTTPYSTDAYEDQYANALADLVAKGEQVAIDKSSPVTLVNPGDSKQLMSWLAKLQETAA